MLKFLSVSVLAWALSAPAAQGAVIFFDDIVTGGGIVPLPLNYGGISWDDPNFGVYGFDDNPWNPQSAPNKVLVNRLTGGQTAISFSFLAPVVFNGAYFSGTDGAGTLTLDLYLANVLVATSPGLNLTSIPTFLATNYGGLIDRVTINGVGGQYVFDDVTFNANTVPEPATGALLGLSLLGGGLFLRRRKQSA